jgi:hypothetical protein
MTDRDLLAFATYHNASHCGHQHQTELAATNCALNRSHAHHDQPVRVGYFTLDGAWHDMGAVTHQPV